MNLNKIILEVIQKELGEEIVSVPTDPNAYKREGVNFYIANVGLGNKPNKNTKWVQIKDQNKIRSIEKNIFKGQSGTYLQQGNTISKNKWIGCKNGFVGGSVKIIGDKPFPKGFFKIGDQVNITGYKNNPGAKVINGFAKIKSIDPNLKGIVIDRPWPSSIKGIQDECASVSKVESNIVNNAKKCGWGTDTKGYVNSGYECPKRSEYQKMVDIMKKYSCVPVSYRIPLDRLIQKKYDKTLLKAALGVIGRESSYGSGLRYEITAPLKRLGNFFGQDTSIGPGQMKQSTADSLGIKEDITTVEGALTAVYKYLDGAYKMAINSGYSTKSPSSNTPKSDSWSGALDIAIASYNVGRSKIKKYCKTTDPTLKRDCKFAGQFVTEQFDQSPHGDSFFGKLPKYQDGKLKVLNEPVPNYLPNFPTKRWDGVSITTHGYVKEVTSRMKKFNCF